MLDVLRNGFKCYGKTFKIAYFQPNTGMNPETLEQYQKNRLTVTRQVTIKTGKIPDILLSHQRFTHSNYRTQKPPDSANLPKRYPSI